MDSTYLFHSKISKYEIPPTKTAVIDFVCEKYKIKEEDLRLRLKKEILVESRAMISFVLVRDFQFRLEEVGLIINRSHSDVYHIINKIDVYYQTKRFRDTFTDLCEKMNLIKSRKYLKKLQNET